MQYSDVNRNSNGRLQMLFLGSMYRCMNDVENLITQWRVLTSCVNFQKDKLSPDGTQGRKH